MSVPATLQETLSLDAITLSDVEAIRAILKGESIVDWHRLDLETPEEAWRFVHSNGFTQGHESDAKRIESLVRRAVSYLETNFHYRLPPGIRLPMPATDLLLLASSRSPLQGHACVVLKVVHILNHVDARELRFRLPVSEDALLRRAEDAVTRAVREIATAGGPIETFVASRKSRDSVITKLLSKKSAVASAVFDRLRFRIVTRTALDLVPVLAHLKDRVLPFNYVVPGQSRNDILPPEAIIEAAPRLRNAAARLRYRFQIEEADPGEDWNRFSADDYRMINFVVDLPLRVDEMVAATRDPALVDLGAIVFVPVEFQMFDAATFAANELGESRHESYKDRQKWDVIRRLLHGGPFGGAGGPGFGGRIR
jgi:uncharacterized protein (TIGR04552 family)